MNMILSVTGLAGGLLCAVADIFLDIKGKDNVKCGSKGIMDSNWVKMPEWRFVVSILLAMVAVPMYSMGVISLGNQIGEVNIRLGDLLKLSIFIGAIGGFFIHTFICIVPIIYKEIVKDNTFELADRVITKICKAIQIPFGVFYLILILVPAGIVCYSIITEILQVPVWFVLLNPVVFQLVGWILRAVKRDWFYEIPSVFMASLGLGMYGIIGIVNL